MVKEPINHLPWFPANENNWRVVVPKKCRINGQSDVIQLAANLLESCLAEFANSGNSIRVLENTCFTKFCQFDARRKCHTGTIIVMDLLECLVP